MKNTFILISALALFFICACEQQMEGIEPSKCRDGECSFTIFDDRQLSTFPFGAGERQLTLEQGDKWVFWYVYNEDQHPLVSGRSYFEVIAFEVDPNLSTFSISDSSLRDAHAFVMSNGECKPDDFFITEGSISGEKTAFNRWNVTIDIGFPECGFIKNRRIIGSFELSPF